MCFQGSSNRDLSCCFRAGGNFPIGPFPSGRSCAWRISGPACHLQWVPFPSDGANSFLLALWEFAAGMGAFPPGCIRIDGEYFCCSGDLIVRNLNLSELSGLAIGLGRTYRMLEKMPRVSRDEMLAWQLGKIRNLVQHAYLKIPFYKALYSGAGFQLGDLKTWEDFRRLPVVKKDDVVANYPERMLEAGYDLDRLIVSRSSGSSGKVLDIAYDQRAMSTFILAGLRLYRMGFRYLPWHKHLYVYTSPYPLSSLFGLYPLHFVSTLTPIPEIVSALRRVRPALLVCYPSHLRQIAAAIPDKERNSLGLKVISVNSEMSTQLERDELKRQFGCPVLDEYSSEELTRIAAQCLSGSYHIFEDINYMEVLDDSGKPVDGLGVLVGTNLHNYAMPMIRYQQNDLGSIHESKCGCGWRFRSLTQLEGRRNDSFIMPSGKVLSSGFLLDATYEFLLNYRTAIREFCLIQESCGSVTLQIVPDSGWSNEVSSKIAQRFRNLLEADVSFQITVVEACEKTKSGKQNPIVCRVKTVG